MAYRIEYAPSEKVLKGRTQNRIRWMIIGGAFCLAAGIVHVTGLGNALRDLLIPGDPEVTVAAWNCMVDALQEGTGLGQAASLFCRQVLEGAGLEG